MARQGTGAGGPGALALWSPRWGLAGLVLGGLLGALFKSGPTGALIGALVLGHGMSPSMRGLGAQGTTPASALSALGSALGYFPGGERRFGWGKLAVIVGIGLWLAWATRAGARPGARKAA